MMMECTEYERALLDEIMCRAQCGECFNPIFFKNPAETPGVVTAACLSQWYPSEFELEGQRYVHAEQYMMAEKARLFGDLSTLRALLQTTSPGKAKALGRSVQGFDQACWQSQRFDIGLRGNFAKFSQNAALKDFLLIGTGNRLLAEASPDRIWGIGLSAKDEYAHDPLHWRGLNLLGLALMQVRDKLRSQPTG